MSIFEGELGDAGFVEFAQTFRDHPVVLFLGRACEGEIETETAGEFERDAAVLGGVRGGEETTVLAVLHVFTVGLEYTRVRASL
jgi:hypothetical protein